MRANHMCANANANVDQQKKQDHTPRWLNLISGAQALIPIENIPRGGDRCMANLMTNDVELKTNYNTLSETKECN